MLLDDNTRKLPLMFFARTSEWGASMTTSPARDTSTLACSVLNSAVWSRPCATMRQNGAVTRTGPEISRKSTEPLLAVLELSSRAPTTFEIRARFAPVIVKSPSMFEAVTSQ